MTLCLGMMSGTSLDGVDIAACRFWAGADGRARYRVERAATYPYPDEWRRRLEQAPALDGYRLSLLHNQYGAYLGQLANRFLAEGGWSAADAALVASHGHTVFHDPSAGLTLQIGCGAAIHAATGIRVACDFRRLDVALGGQGAPLVPIGDAHLFGDHAFCLNLGGFANVSYASGGGRVAFDVGPCNIVLNALASRLGLPYDAGGAAARQGSVDTALLAALDALPYYAQPAPKSLGREWVEQAVWPLVEGRGGDPRDLLRTFVEHIARQVARATGQGPAAAVGGSVLATGGGAHNAFLVERMRGLSARPLLVPDALTVDYKEAIVFAYLGWLKTLGCDNVVAQCTGAARGSSSGVIVEG